MSDPTSQKPYLLRALYEWCVDNGFTPYVAVTVDAETRVPMEYVRNGEIVLNIGPLAANKLRIGNNFIDFAARFGGVTKDIVVPVPAVAAIYARENGHGMTFEVSTGSRAHRPQLDTVISKSRSGEPRSTDGGPVSPLREVSANNTAERKPGDEEPDPKPSGSSPGGRPNLRRIK
jgi:stringent starvation protein B